MPALLRRLTHIGVDPAKPRSETKHIVLTNTIAVLFTLVNGVVAVSPALSAFPLFVRVTFAAASCLCLVMLLLNGLGLHTAASAWARASSSSRFS